MKTGMKIELHIVQNFAPSCLNRDDANAPKDCVFGGFRRARISSQCIKRAVRWHDEFRERVAGPLGTRTRRIVELVAKEVAERVGTQREAVEPVVAQIVAKALAGLDRSATTTRVLLFLGEDEIRQLIDLIVGSWGELEPAAAKGDALKKKAKELAKKVAPSTRAVDVVLFGRMIAEKPDWNIDAACQVAHAISTHAVDMEMDFYTAVDDLNPQEKTGAGMMGVVEFNSACYYRYSLLDWDQLVDNLGDGVELARSAVEGYLRASILAVPSGKQNSMAAHNLPAFVLAVVRDGGVPCSLANAFEKPVWVSHYDRNKGLVEKSVERLDEFWGAHVKMYGDRGIREKVACWLDSYRPDLKNLGDYRVGSIDELVGRVLATLPGDGGG